MDFQEVLDYLGSGNTNEDELNAMRDAIDEIVPRKEEEPDEPPYWATDEPTVFELAGERVNLLKRGRPQLRQIDALREWLKVWARPIVDRSVKARKDSEEGGDAEDMGIDVILELLNSEALIELGCILLGKEDEFVGEYFDIGWIIDGVTVLVKYQPGIKRLTQGFFGRLGS